MIALKSVQKFRIIVAIDRSDKTIAVAIYLGKGEVITEDVSTRSGALKKWWTRIREDYPDAIIAVAFEQPARNLIAFFESESDVIIYALNPVSIWGYRQSLTVSRAHTDQSDALCIGQFVSTHIDQLTPYKSASSIARKMGYYCKSRRKLVDMRTKLTNRIQDVLKSYYPDVLDIFQENIYRQINLEFLRKWSNPQSLMKAQKRTLEAFFRSQGSHSQKRLYERLQIIKNMDCITDNEAIIEPAQMEVLAIADQIEVLSKNIRHYDTVIASLMKEAGDKAQMISDLPGAGPIMAPRVFAAFEANMPNCKSSASIAALVGMAPVTEQSGKMRRVYRRLRCDHFLRQSFHEWAKESWKYSVWAKAYVRHHQERGKPYHTIIRSLAVKWIRIIYRLWETGEFYDEQRYIQSLIKQNHYLKYALQ